MYDRATRDPTKAGTSTLETVGPGSYDVPGFLRGKNRGYAPFGSMTGRETFVDVADQTMAAPGPGQYDPLLINKDRVRGGHSLSNKSKRFDNTEQENPGPGSYNLSKQTDWLKTRPIRPPNHEENQAGKHLVFVRKVDPPSIPSPGKAYGYEESYDGSLKPQTMPDTDKSMGPAFYNVDHRDTQTTRSYKGVFFGKKGPRKCYFQATTAHGKEIPGPGTYHPFEPQENKTPLDLILEENNKRFFEAKIPRYHELVVKEQEKKAVPAPTQYEIRSQFNTKVVTAETDHTAFVAPFGSQARRFGETKNTHPAPGSYDDPRTALDALKRIKGAKGSPFGQTAIRFQNNTRRKTQPGPGSYHIPDEVSTMVRKNMLTKKRQVPFGSSSVRTAPMSRVHEELYPGPAHYTNPDIPTKKEVQLSSTFASMTDRLHTPPPLIKDMPPPGSYEVRKSYDTTQGRVLYPYAQRKDRNIQKRGAFLSSSTRFTNNSEVPQKRYNTPGPGQYNLDESQPAPGGLMVVKDTRFKEKKSDVPGPGNYELSPQYAHSVLKGTFNATLNNPMTKVVYEDHSKGYQPKQEQITITST